MSQNVALLPPASVSMFVHLCIYGGSGKGGGRGCCLTGVYNTLVSNQISICAHQKPKEESVYEIFAARRAAKWPRGRGRRGMGQEET